MDVNEMIDLIDFWCSNAISRHFMEKSWRPVLVVE
jgi:hypothetical protein